MERRLETLAFILAILLLLPLAAFGAPVGKITVIEGNVDITSPGATARDAGIGDAVSQGDILRAKSKSKAEVTFHDGNILRLAEGTRVRITQYTGGEQKNNYLDLFRGKTQSVVKAVSKGGTYEMHTPTAIVGVRGTTLISYYINGVSGAVFKEGTGYGYNRNMPKDIRTIAAGQAMLVIAPNQRPLIKAATSVEIEKHITDTTPSKEKGKEEKKEGGADKGKKDAAGKAGEKGTAEQDKAEKTEASGKTDEDLAKQQQDAEAQQSAQAQQSLQQQQLAQQTVQQVTQQAAQQQRSEQLQQQTVFKASVGSLPTDSGIFQLTPGKMTYSGYRNWVNYTNGSYRTRDNFVYFTWTDPQGQTKKTALMEMVDLPNNLPSGAPNNKFDVHYYPDGKFIKADKGRFYSQPMNYLNPQPDFAADPPASPWIAATGYSLVSTSAKDAWGTYTGLTDKQLTRYVEFSWDGNSLEKVGAISGSMEGVSGTPPWTATAASPAKMIMKGDATYGTGSLLASGLLSTYNPALSPTVKTLNTGEAFVAGIHGAVNGAVADSTAVNLRGTTYSLYMNAAGNEVGVLKGAFQGKACATSKIWETTDATLYKLDGYGGAYAGSVTPSTFSTYALDSLNIPQYDGLRWGATDGQTGGTIMNQAGPFTGNLAMDFGRTVSIKNRDDFGLISIRHGVGTSFSNPSGATTWTAAMAGIGQFGVIDLSAGSYVSQYADGGIYMAAITGTEWKDGWLSGSLNGKFLTLTKAGILSGETIGTYTPGTTAATSGTWQATSTGAWRKDTTQTVYAGSILLGTRYVIGHEKAGFSIASAGATDHYSYAYDDLSYAWGNSFFGYNSRPGGATRTQINYDSSGFPGAEGKSKRAYTYDVTTNTWTHDTFNDPSWTQADLQALENPPLSMTLETHSRTILEERNSVYGVAAILDPFTGSTSSRQRIWILGQIDKKDRIYWDWGARNPWVFGGETASFDPLVANDPYENSQSPNNGPAYKAYIGAACGSDSLIDGTFYGVQMNNEGGAAKYAGIVYGGLDRSRSSFEPASGGLDARGEASIYTMTDLTQYSGYSSAGFLTKDFQKNHLQEQRNRYWYDDPGIAAVVSAGEGAFTLRAETLNNMFFVLDKTSNIGAGWGVFSNAIAGAYAPGGTGGRPTDFSLMRDRTDAYENRTWVSTSWTRASDVVWNDANQTVTGNLVGAGQSWISAAMYIAGGEFRGVFDPANKTVQLMAGGVTMDPLVFLGQINAMATDDEKQKFVSATKIPAFNVGQAELSGSASFAGGSMAVSMKDVTFFAPSTGGEAKLWVSAPNTLNPGAGVSGSYTGSPAAGWSVPLNQVSGTGVSGLKADFEINRWNYSNPAGANNWGATVNGSGTVNAKSIGFSGGAAGKINAGAFWGNAAGIAVPKQ